MPKTESLDELIAQRAAEFADQVKAAAVMADKEEEIRIEVERQLAFIEKDAGVKLEGRHEFTVAQGRADSVYQRVIIEYKNPKSPGARIGPKSDSPGTKKVVEQLKNRFYDMQRELGHPLNSLFGVGLDGNYFVFIRYRDNKWQPQDPVEVNKYSAERFLWALYNLGQKGKPFSSEYLAGDFGSDSPLAQDGVRTLYEAISTTDHPKAQVFFNQWKILFGEVCGYDVDNPSDKIKKLAEFYGIQYGRKLRPAELLFAVHSYYAIFMKLLASEIAAYFHKLPTPLQKMIQAGSSKALKREMEDLELGSIFRHLNITNFLEGDLFAWYTSIWSESIEHLVRGMVVRLDDYNPGTLSEEPASSRDLLKKLYQQLFPEGVRHDLGEYYTPDWLAEQVLNELDYVGDPDKRLLDPACGSGTFLVMAINRIRNWYDEHREELRFDEGELCKRILSNVVGFDLNPLAVMAARTNYLIAIRNLIGHVGRVEIPIYLCDSIMTPSEHGGLLTGGVLGKAKAFQTAAAKFIIPTEITTNRDEVAKYAEHLEFCIRNGYSPEDFIERCRDEGLPVSEETLHTDLYEELVKLDRANKNGVWARIIKNAFAPLFLGRVNYIAGNPPWITWVNLPEQYRAQTGHLWQSYKIFPHKGLKARLGHAKDDISILFTYVCSDAYLATQGRLGFVITQSVFKSKGGGQGFRRFRLADKDFLGVVCVHDMSRLQPFEGATNRTAVLTVRKGVETEYPVSYTVWSKGKGFALTMESPLSDVRDFTVRVELSAFPIDPNDRTSPWITGERELLTRIRSNIKPSDYVARMGAHFGASGVFWSRIIENENKGKLLIENTGGGKKHVPIRISAIEPDLMYPIVRGRDMEKWFCKPVLGVIMVQDENNLSRPMPLNVLKRTYPHTYQHLLQFEDLLRNCAILEQFFDPAKDPFYSTYQVGPYSFAPIKVIWRQVADNLDACVAEAFKLNGLPTKPCIPADSLCAVALDNDEEAHYLCAMLNNSISRYVIRNYVALHPSPHILEYLNIRRWDKRNSIAVSLSRFSKECHQKMLIGETTSLPDLESSIDSAAAELWGIGANGLDSIQKALSLE